MAGNEMTPPLGGMLLCTSRVIAAKAAIQ